ncbi:MAG: metallophosphoesterase [Roseiflexaceae bacterium]|nr:metallophosphoesterase [Roseiflexaceae bacterium]
MSVVLLLRALELFAVMIMGRWLAMRLRRVLLLPTNDTTEPIGAERVAHTRKIIVSDLHFGAGDRADDFTADDEFVEFMVRYVQQEQPTELILNGDTFEFLQVRLPGVGDYDFSAWAAAQRLNTILAAHPQVIGALRDFVAKPGNEITIIIGNHDFELHYASAKQLLHQALNVPESESRLRFGISYEGHGLYLEHGNQFDSWNAFVHFGGIAQPFEIVRGTRVVKDVINPLEEDPLDVAPLIDNVKPTSAFLWYMLSLPQLRKPAARRYVTRGLLRMFRTVALPTVYKAKPMLAVREELLGAPGETLQREIALQARYELDPALRQAAAAKHGGEEPELRLRQRGRALVAGVARRLGRSRDVEEAALNALQTEARANLRAEIRAFKTETQRAMSRTASSTAHQHNTLFVCGHTHAAEVVPLGEDKTYINTGTWTQVVWNIATGLYESRRFPFLEVTYPEGAAMPHGRLLVWYGVGAPPPEWSELEDIDRDESIVAIDKEETV